VYLDKGKIMKLEIIAGADAGKKFEIPDYGTVTLGRGEACDITLNDKQCSREHARITHTSDHHVVIEDLDSTNGIMVDHIRKDRAVLREKSLVSMGGTSFLVIGVPGQEAAKSLFQPHDDHEQSVWLSMDHADADLLKGDQTQSPGWDIQRENAVLRDLCDFTRLIAAEQDVQRIAGAFLDHIKKVIKADTACLLVRNDAGEWMMRATSSDVTDLESITISRTILEKALSQGAVLLCQDAQSDERFDASQSIMRHGISSAICSPIKTGEEFTGVLFVDRRKRHTMFESMDVRFVATLANILGVLLEKEKLEVAMRERERLATIGQVIAGLAHYAKNLIHGLALGTGLLKSIVRTKRYDQLHNCVKSIELHEKRLSDLLLDMLNYSKDRVVKAENVNLVGLLEEIITPYKQQHEEHGITLDFDAPAECPFVRGEENALHRIFLNLIRNAMDAVGEKPKQDSRAITIRITAKPDESLVHTTVHDTGTGIPSDKLESIFDAFFSTKGSRGTGLGLAVVKKMVQEHGGDISVDSCHGEWTQFRVSLPAVME
jgi:signal transduction histidine kinase/pSer/pThr/pTyr-binding forkhead associated (FHA) protein